MDRTIRGPFTILPGDLDDPRVVDLLTRHLVRARAESAPGSAHALDIDGLRAADITLWTIWQDERLLGTGALKTLSPEHGEVKSMHTEQAYRRRRAGSRLLDHMIAEARSRGMRRLSLETGSWDFFRPAVAFYRKYGFVACPPFGTYRADPNSVFLTLDLTAGDEPGGSVAMKHRRDAG